MSLFMELLFEIWKCVNLICPEVFSKHHAITRMGNKNGGVQTMCSALVFHNARLKFNEASRQLTAATLPQWGEIFSERYFLFSFIFVFTRYLSRSHSEAISSNMTKVVMSKDTHFCKFETILPIANMKKCLPFEEQIQSKPIYKFISYRPSGL